MVAEMAVIQLTINKICLSFIKQEKSKGCYHM